jgi:hypothetical protein
LKKASFWLCGKVIAESNAVEFVAVANGYGSSFSSYYELVYAEISTNHKNAANKTECVRCLFGEEGILRDYSAQAF